MKLKHVKLTAEQSDIQTLLNHVIISCYKEPDKVKLAAIDKTSFTPSVKQAVIEKLELNKPSL